jgi:hypothetical protein
MTAPIRITPEYELYRVVTDYEALQDGFADRIEDLNTPLTEIDVAAGLTQGHMQRLINADPEAWRPKGKRRQSREFGWKTLAAALKGTGLALALVIDDERFASLKKQFKRKRKVRAVARIRRIKGFFTEQNAAKHAKKRWEGVPDLKRARLARKAANARWKAVRRRKALAGASLISTEPASSAHGQQTPVAGTNSSTQIRDCAAV